MFFWLIVGLTQALPLKEQARAVIEVHCGVCHQPSSGRARPDSLAVYDLSDADWTRKMSATQLSKMVEMFTSRTTMTPEEREEAAGGIKMDPPTAAEITLITQFIEQELLTR